MKILFINSSKKWGGVKSWTMDFGSMLMERGHEIALVARPGSLIAERGRAAGFSVHETGFGAKYNPVSILRIRSLIKRERPDLIVVNISKDLNIGAVAAKLAGVPVVHRVGLVEDFLGRREEELHHRLLVDRVVVPCRYLRDALLSRFDWLDPEKFEVVHNSKRLDRFDPGAQSSSGQVVFGVSSQLSPSKGHVHLLRAFRKVIDAHPSALLRIAGTGHLEAELKALASELSIEERVEFLGFVDDIPGFLAALDVYVLPSLKEGFPNALLEAMCAGRALVGFDIPGVVEMIEGAGVITPLSDEDRLGDELTKLAGDEELRRALGRAAAERAKRDYDITANVVKLEAAFARSAKS